MTPLRRRRDQRPTQLAVASEIHLELDRSGRFLDPSEPVLTLFAILPGRLAGYSFVEAIAAAGDPDAARAVALALEKAVPITRLAVSFQHPGRRLHFRLTLRPIRSPRRQITGYAGAFSDETQLWEALDELDHSGPLAAIGAAATSIAHDFRNNLQIIMGNAQIIAEEAAELAASSRAQIITRRAGVIQKQAKQAIALINELTDFARPDPTPVPAGVAIQDMAALLGHALPNGAHLQLRIENRSAVIGPSRTTLYRMLANLVQNAGDALAGRTGRVSIAVHLHDPGYNPYPLLFEQPPGRMRPHVQTDGPEHRLFAGHLDAGSGHLSIEIEDTGAGIAPLELGSVLERGFSTKRRRAGQAGRHGLGLDFVRCTVEYHAGAIVIATVPGQLTRVTLLLPVIDMRPGAAAPMHTAADLPTIPSDAPTLRILLVDDDLDLLDSVATRLRRCHCLVRCAESGHAAMALLRDEPYDAIICDHDMPHMTGLDLLAWLRDHPAHQADARPSRILFTADPSVEAHGHPAVDRYFEKPIDAETLYRAVVDLRRGG